MTTLTGRLSAREMSTVFETGTEFRLVEVDDQIARIFVDDSIAEVDWSELKAASAVSLLDAPLIQRKGTISRAKLVDLVGGQKKMGQLFGAVGSCYVLVRQDAINVVLYRPLLRRETTANWIMSPIATAVGGKGRETGELVRFTLMS